MTDYTSCITGPYVTALRAPSICAAAPPIGVLRNYMGRVANTSNKNISRNQPMQTED